MTKAECINKLGAFCGKRAVGNLCQAALEEKYGFRRADVMVLFGGSILCGGDVLAQAMRNDVAKTYIIVGGEGHTTQTLRQIMQIYEPEIETAGLPEAKIFEAYLEKRYRLRANYLEYRSTNCGNNITFLLELMKAKGISCQSIILVQDATMQLRMEAGLKKYAPEIHPISYAAYQVSVGMKNLQLVYEQEIKGMWSMERYVSLLMGEIVRLVDDNGYGPNGRNYIAHVTIPHEVKEAYEKLKKIYMDVERKIQNL